MSSKRERDRRREQRLREETQVATEDRRTRLLQFGAGAVFVAIVAVAVLIVASAGGGGGGDAKNLKDAGAVDRLLAGIPQKGLALGSPVAKVTVYEYGDLQCPFCKAYSEEVLPPVIEGPVKEGKARIVFRNFTIIGPDSVPAGEAAVAAGEQGRGWNFVELFYRNQGEENSGYANDEFFTAVAKGAGVKNISRWNEDRRTSEIADAVSKSTDDAKKLGFDGTPSFAIQGPGTKGIEPFGTPSSAGELEEAIEEAS
jgi:protein-disulfide isomerase